MTMQMGGLTADMLGKYIKGWGSQAKELIQLDTQRYDVLGNAFPAKPADTEKMEFYTVHGNPGRMGVSLDTAVEATSWAPSRVTCDLKWDKFEYFVSDGAKTRVAVDTYATDGTRMAMNFFGAVRTYRALTALAAGNATGNTASATAAWNTAGADVEGDIVAGIEKIVDTTGATPETSSFGLIYPADRLRGIAQLALINNVQQSMKEYLGKIWNIEFIPYSPYKNADGSEYLDVKNLTASDALSTNAILYIKGDTTLRNYNYNPSDIPMVETSRVHDAGYRTTLRHCYGSVVVPKYDASTTVNIYKITGC